MQNLMPPVNTPDKLFHDGDPSQGIEGTIVSAEFMNNEQGAVRDSQQELINILTAASMAPDPSKTDQIITALRMLFLDASAGSALPVGVPVPWPLATPPQGWLKCNGAGFDKVQYPKLGTAYPSGTLPDLRAEFLRGWDDGRGFDSGRSLLSKQDSQNLSHYHEETAAYGGSPGGVVSSDKSRFAKTYYVASEALFSRPVNGWTGATSDLITASSGGNESRPRNVAFNYIVRAA